MPIPNVAAGSTRLKLLATLSRFAPSSKKQISRVRPFDDGLVELARLIAREDSTGDAKPPPDAASTERTLRISRAHRTDDDTA